MLYSGRLISTRRIPRQTPQVKRGDDRPRPPSRGPFSLPPQRPTPRTTRDRLPPLPRSALYPRLRKRALQTAKAACPAEVAGADRTGGTIAVPVRPGRGRLLADEKTRGPSGARTPPREGEQAGFPDSGQFGRQREPIGKAP